MTDNEPLDSQRRGDLRRGPYTIEQLARDALGLLHHLGLQRIRFFGLSMGGMVGQWLGANAAQRFSRLILCDTAAQIGTPDIWNTRIDALNQGGMAAIVDGVLARWCTAPFIASAPGAIEATHEMLLTTPAAGYIASCAAVRDMNQLDSTSRIAIPTLIVVGTHDMVTTPADGRFLADHIAGAHFAELPAAHLSNVERRRRLPRHSLNFLSVDLGRCLEFERGGRSE